VIAEMAGFNRRGPFDLRRIAGDLLCVALTSFDFHPACHPHTLPLLSPLHHHHRTDSHLLSPSSSPSAVIASRDISASPLESAPATRLDTICQWPLLRLRLLRLEPFPRVLPVRLVVVEEHSSGSLSVL
jgi:hypothetical protein